MLSDLDLDLDIIRHTPFLDISAKGVARSYGLLAATTRLLNADTEAADVVVSWRSFHSGIVLRAKECLYSLVFAGDGTLILLVVFPPLGGLGLAIRSRRSGGTATCSFNILYMKVRRLMRRRSSRGSNLSCRSRSVTLVSRVS